MNEKDFTYPVKGKVIGITPNGKITPILQVKTHNPDFIKYEEDWYIRCDSWLLIPLDMTYEDVYKAKENARKWREENIN